MCFFALFTNITLTHLVLMSPLYIEFNVDVVFFHHVGDNCSKYLIFLVPGQQSVVSVISLLVICVSSVPLKGFLPALMFL